ncbi:MAG TPA: hypothetical protein VMG38_25000 [Trebonia sp.]|nr:hypothetical protein [Trebonia sp.]
MTGYLMHVNATVNCPHGGSAGYLPAQRRALVTGQPAASVAGLWTVAGCSFTVAGKPQPCVTIRWLSPSGRITLSGSPAELSNPAGTCFSAEQVAQGPAVISVVQHRVVGE